jgi:hypothetical protein
MHVLLPILISRGVNGRTRAARYTRRSILLATAMRTHLLSQDKLRADSSLRLQKQRVHCDRFAASKHRRTARLRRDPLRSLDRKGSRKQLLTPCLEDQKKVVSISQRCPQRLKGQGGAGGGERRPRRPWGSVGDGRLGALRPHYVSFDPTPCAADFHRVKPFIPFCGWSPCSGLAARGSLEAARALFPVSTEAIILPSGSALLPVVCASLSTCGLAALARSSTCWTRQRWQAAANEGRFLRSARGPAWRRLSSLRV